MLGLLLYQLTKLGNKTKQLLGILKLRSGTQLREICLQHQL